MDAEPVERPESESHASLPHREVLRIAAMNPSMRYMARCAYINALEGLENPQAMPEETRESD